MEVVRPRKLVAGDQVRVIAPARSRAMVIEHDFTGTINRRFAELGLRLSYGAHVDERDRRDSSTISSRVADLHAAFADPDVAGVLTVIGGYNSNELLPHLDWELIRANPKVFCGYSDVTVLQNAMLARAGLMTYSGPHWSSFGMMRHFEQTLRWFVDAILQDEPVTLTATSAWTDDAWFLDQEHREVLDGDGWWTIRSGEAGGRLVGGNLCTLNLLQGTPWMPSIAGAVLVVEDDEESHAEAFARDLTSLMQQSGAHSIRALVIGRFQRASRVDRRALEALLASAGVPSGIPILGNVDFGHTQPMMTLPIGGEIVVRADEHDPELVLTTH